MYTLTTTATARTLAQHLYDVGAKDVAHDTCRGTCAALTHRGERSEPSVSHHRRPKLREQCPIAKDDEPEISPHRLRATTITQLDDRRFNEDTHASLKRRMFASRRVTIRMFAALIFTIRGEVPGPRHELSSAISKRRFLVS